MGVDISLTIHPESVRRAARLASFSYPIVREQELFKGWANVPVWPLLWHYLVKRGGRFPVLDELVGVLMEHSDVPSKAADPQRLRARAQKLVMDFTRDIHAWGLLYESRYFASVRYVKVLDLEYNVDFLAVPMWQDQDVGIQTAMRASWTRDEWTRVKAERRQRRGANEWTGQLYWMTNHTISAEQLPNKLWLFTPAHVDEVIAQIDGGLRPTLF